jgi:hypothetical protein
VCVCLRARVCACVAVQLEPKTYNLCYDMTKTL